MFNVSNEKYKSGLILLPAQIGGIVEVSVITGLLLKTKVESHVQSLVGAEQHPVTAS